jgi:hypothetical protein
MLNKLLKNISLKGHQVISLPGAPICPCSALHRRCIRCYVAEMKWYDTGAVDAAIIRVNMNWLGNLCRFT